MTKDYIIVSPAIAHLETDDAAKLLLKALGFNNASPKESTSTDEYTYLYFTDEYGVGRVVSYGFNESEFGTCELKDAHVQLCSVYNEVPIRQADLFRLIVELEDDPNTSKWQALNRIRDFMNSYE